jgi:hypothetical protein
MTLHSFAAGQLCTSADHSGTEINSPQIATIAASIPTLPEIMICSRVIGDFSGASLINKPLGSP